MLCYRLWVTLVAILLLLLLPPLPMEARMLSLWRGVPVSYMKVINAGKTQLEDVPMPHGAGATLYCSKLCTRRSWCNLWCPHPSINQTHCIVSDIIIMPTYIETSLSDVLPCNTRRHVDLATNAIITAGEETPPAVDKVKENLVDGFYSYQMSELYASPQPADKKWFVLDFSQTVTFTHVILYVQNNDRAHIQFVDVEVRVGNVTVTPPSGFSGYDLFGFFPGAAFYGQVVMMVSSKPVSARFVSVQMLRDNLRPFQVAHVEVY